MAYTPPVTGGLFLTASGVNIGIWMDTSLEGSLGDNFIAARLDAGSGWTAFWSSGANQTTDWNTMIASAGGIVAYITSQLAAINVALKNLFTVAPVPTPTTSYSVAAFNSALTSAFSLKLVNGIPVISAN